MHSIARQKRNESMKELHLSRPQGFDTGTCDVGILGFVLGPDILVDLLLTLVPVIILALLPVV